jgi:hypothetical protein
MSEARCRACDAPIIWAETVVDRTRIPLDQKPVADGRFKLDETYNPPRVEYVRAGDPPGDRFNSHLMTCKKHGEI